MRRQGQATPREGGGLAAPCHVTCVRVQHFNDGNRRALEAVPLPTKPDSRGQARSGDGGGGGGREGRGGGGKEGRRTRSCGHRGRRLGGSLSQPQGRHLGAPTPDPNAPTSGPRSSQQGV
eukprot:2596418-Rhodomonas_salina.1